MPRTLNVFTIGNAKNRSNLLYSNKISIMNLIINA